MAEAIKAGKTKYGSQRYKCKGCQPRHTPEPKPQSYPEEIRQEAVRLYVDGMNYRRIARHLSVDHKSVMNWVKAHAVQQAEAPVPADPRWMSCIPLSGQKNRIYVMTLVDRHTSCILSWAVEPERSETCLQQLVDDTPQAAYYFSSPPDLCSGRYTLMPNKSETYRVEGDNAEIRHYLARLARRSRCFSHCITALRGRLSSLSTLGTPDNSNAFAIFNSTTVSAISYKLYFPTPLGEFFNLTQQIT